MPCQVRGYFPVMSWLEEVVSGQVGYGIMASTHSVETLYYRTNQLG